MKKEIKTLFLSQIIITVSTLAVFYIVFALLEGLMSKGWTFEKKTISASPGLAFVWTLILTGLVESIARRHISLTKEIEIASQVFYLVGWLILALMALFISEITVINYFSIFLFFLFFAHAYLIKNEIFELVRATNGRWQKGLVSLSFLLEGGIIFYGITFPIGFFLVF